MKARNCRQQAILEFERELRKWNGKPREISLPKSSRESANFKSKKGGREK